MVEQVFIEAQKHVQSSKPIVGGVLQCGEFRMKKPALQRSAIGSAPKIVPPIVHEVLRTPGQPLDSTTRAFLEPRFGHDFSRVRVHTDAKAAESARAVNALAYTVGQNIVFAAGRLAPESSEGRRLLAHELTHVVQQGRHSVMADPLPVGRTRGRHEHEAENAEMLAGPSQDKRLLTSGLNLSQDDGPVLRRWRVSGNTATAEREGDYLGRLARQLGASFNDWKCIKPVRMRTFDSGGSSYQKSRYELFVQAGDVFDVSNLKANTGETLRIHLFDPGSEARDAALAQRFYPGSVASLGPDEDIDNTSQSGSNPIGQFIIFGHAGGNTMWGASASFTPSDYQPEEPSPNYELARTGLFPRRCWFTRNARARSIGCNSEAWGQDFASVYLRKGSSITTTTRSVKPRCQGLPFQLGSLLGIPGGCLYYNGLDFSVSPAIGSATLDGPFWSVSDFHGGAFWSTIRGRL